MGSRKGSAQAKLRAAFKATWGDAGDLFAREEARAARAAEEREAALRAKSCEAKNRYATREDAEAARGACAAHGRHGLTVYRCEYCKGWHLTSHGR